jgi:3-hydroxyacyl-[acyl-carrier-protein] dehydratase
MHEPLLDFERVDLSRVLFGRPEIRRACLQRGRFELVDGILHLDREAGLCVGFQDLAPDDWWAADHVPGRPLFPGALQCEGAAQVCTFDFVQRRPQMQGSFFGFGGLNEVRFRGAVIPPCRLVYAVRPERMRDRFFSYRAQGFVDRRPVFEAEILGVVL